jgi:hypothetical protein
VYDMKMDFGEIGCGVNGWTGLLCLRLRLVECSCEHSHEPSESLKCQNCGGGSITVIRIGACISWTWGPKYKLQTEICLKRMNLDHNNKLPLNIHWLIYSWLNRTYHGIILLNFVYMVLLKYLFSDLPIRSRYSIKLR